MKNQFLKEQGITLIALVVTIIILIILAGVSITMLVGENGIITQAQRAKEETAQAEKEEKRQLTILEASTNMKNTEYYDSTGSKAIIPAGFAVSQIEGEKEIDSGLVIIDTKGNEFVWVPVNNINEMVQCTKTDGNCNLKLQEDGSLKCITHNSNELVGKLYAVDRGENFGTINISYNENSGLREPATLTNDDDLPLQNLMNEYKKMAESVARNGGFYIGRYETSLSTATSTSAGSAGIVQSKRGVIPTASDNPTSYSWYGLYTIQKGLSNNNIVSSMIWGSQYDAMLNWIKNSNSNDKNKITDEKGIGNNTSGIVTVTGDINYSNDVINNIYDLGGNLREWTLEAYDAIYRIERGGNFERTNSPSCRVNNDPNNAHNSDGSRLAIYIK